MRTLNFCDELWLTWVDANIESAKNSHKYPTEGLSSNIPQGWKNMTTSTKNFAEERLQWLPACANIPKDEVLDKEVANHAVLQAWCVRRPPATLKLIGRWNKHMKTSDTSREVQNSIHMSVVNFAAFLY